MTAKHNDFCYQVDFEHQTLDTEVERSYILLSICATLVRSLQGSILNQGDVFIFPRFDAKFKEEETCPALRKKG